MKSLLICLLFVLISDQLPAFTLNTNIAANFDQDDVMMNVADHTCANNGLTHQEILDLAEEAAEKYWNKAPTSRLRLLRGSTLSVAGAFYTDQLCNTGTNCEPNPDLKYSHDVLISCNDDSTHGTNFPQANLYALTAPNNISGGKIVSSTILLNDRHATLGSVSRNDLLLMMAHELGHAVGLGHSHQDHSIMFFQLGVDKEKLSPDDVEGIGYLYPALQPDLGGSCGTTNHHHDHHHHNSSGLLFFVTTLMAAVGIRLLWGLLGRDK